MGTENLVPYLLFSTLNISGDTICYTLYYIHSSEFTPTPLLQQQHDHLPDWTLCLDSFPVTINVDIDFCDINQVKGFKINSY